MKKKRSQNNHYSIMFCPEGRGSPFTLRIHRYTIYLIVAAIALIMIGLAGLVYKTGEIVMRLQQVDSLARENAQFREHNVDLEISSQTVESINNMAAYLNRLASVTDIWGGAAPSAPAPASAVAAAAVRETPDVPAVIRTDADRTSDAAGSGFAASMPNIMPVDGWITKHFAAESRPDSHKGIDIAAAHGTPIRATAMGVVNEVRVDKYLGLTVEIRHDNGFQTRYSHCSQALVSPGDRVSRGQTIALVGNTGRSTAPHVHYEVLKDGKQVDPMSLVGTHGQ